MNNKLKRSIKFAIYIAVITFVLAAIFSIISTSLLSKVSWILGLIIVLIIVLVGILFDMLGIASTAASEAPFNAMAAEKVVGAKEAVLITKNADKFASFCNDVIGDISGIISGALGATILYKIVAIYKLGSLTLMSVLLTSFIAALTVGGKALGKEYAINNAEDIIRRIYCTCNWSFSYRVLY